MNDKTKFKLTPTPRKLVDPAQLAAFGAAAELPPEGQGATPPAAPPVDAKPDFQALDDKRRLPSFVMRFTEREAAMLKVIAETTPNSMHEFCLKAVRQALDKHFL